MGPAHPKTQSLTIGGCHVIPASHEIVRGGVKQRVEPKTMDVLLCLVERAGEVVSRETLEAQVWPDVVVGYEALTQAVAKLRKALGDVGPGLRMIETVSKSGYRLAATAEMDSPASGAPASKPVKDQTSDSGSLPTILVLPFENMSDEPEMEHFGDSLADELITELACCPDVRVIARNSSFYFKGKARVIQDLATLVGARFVVEGGVRRAGDKIRVTAQLVDGISGQGLWAKRFDEQATDPLALQDQIRDLILTALVGEAGLVRKSDARRAWTKEQTKLDEYDYYLRVHDLLYRFTREDNARAREIACEGLRHYPDSAMIKIKLGFVLVLDVRFSWSKDPETDLASALELANQGLADDRLHTYGQAIGHWMRAYAVLLGLRNFERAVADISKACELAPNDSDLLASASLILIYAGELEPARDCIEQATRLGVRTRSYFNRFLGWICFHQEQYAEAAECARLVSLVSAEALRMQAVCYLRAGLPEDARNALAGLRELDPGICLSRLRSELPYRRAADLDRELDALRECGLPEDTHRAAVRSIR